MLYLHTPVRIPLCATILLAGEAPVQAAPAGMRRAFILFVVFGFLSAASAKYIVSERSDGLGSQVHAKISCLLEASASSSLQYVHSPLRRLAHGVSREKAEDFFNLGENEIPVGLVNVSGAQVGHCHTFADRNAHLYALLRPLLRSKYYSPAATRKPHIQEFRPEAVNVAVHIRQGDALKQCANLVPWPKAGFSRCVPHNETAAMMLGVASMLKVHNISQHVNFQIYTQGQLQGFPTMLFQQHGYEFHENTDTEVLSVFHAFVSADILVLGHSSLSYLAALYNENIVVWHPFWYSKVKGWLEYTDGHLDDSELHIEKLRNRIASRTKSGVD